MRYNSNGCRINKLVVPGPITTVIKKAVYRIVKLQSEPLELAIRDLWKEVKVALVAQKSAKQLRSLRGKHNLKIHIGCGDDIKSGWVNIDVLPRISSRFNPASDQETVIVSYDLRLGLPLESDSCDLIYSSHFLEHLEYRYGLKLLRDCLRVLCRGGIFRAALPNFRKMFEAYIGRDHDYFKPIDILQVLPEIEPGMEALVDQINYGVYQHGEHKCIYDEEKIVLVLKRLGFSTVNLSVYREGIDPRTEIRQSYSFYVEAVK